jgi:hypothetical protein
VYVRALLRLASKMSTQSLVLVSNHWGAGCLQVFADVKPHMRVWKEEIFGPVLSVMTFTTEVGRADLADCGGQQHSVCIACIVIAMLMCRVGCSACGISAPKDMCQNSTRLVFQLPLMFMCPAPRTGGGPEAG